MLQDTVKDTETTTDEIADPFDVAVADSVRALSKDKRSDTMSRMQTWHRASRYDSVDLLCGPRGW